jgi:hypothetical protein
VRAPTDIVRNCPEDASPEGRGLHTNNPHQRGSHLAAKNLDKWSVYLYLARETEQMIDTITRWNIISRKFQWAITVNELHLKSVTQIDVVRFNHHSK